MLKYVVCRGKEKYQIEDMVQEFSVSGDIETYHRSCEVVCKNTDGQKRLFSFMNGELHILYINNEEVFRGYLFNHSTNESGEVSLMLYDANVYLSKNEDVLFVKNTKASSVVSSLCAKFGIPVGRIDDTGSNISKLVFNGDSLSEIIKQCLTETVKSSTSKYAVYSDKGKFYLVNRNGAETSEFIFTEVLTSTRRVSIEDTKTQVKVVKGDIEKGIKSTIQTSSNTSKFGLMQVVESVDEDTSVSQMLEKAKSLLKQLENEEDTIEIRLPGVISCKTGRRVQVKNELSNVIGTYFITADSHEFRGNNYYMNLQLSKRLGD